MSRASGVVGCISEVRGEKEPQRNDASESDFYTSSYIVLYCADGNVLESPALNAYETDSIVIVFCSSNNGLTPLGWRRVIDASERQGLDIVVA